MYEAAFETSGYQIINSPRVGIKILKVWLDIKKKLNTKIYTSGQTYIR